MNTPWPPKRLDAPSSAIVHVVSWRLNGSSAPARAKQARRIVAAFEAMRGRIDGLLRLEAGAGVIEAPDAWDVAVVMVFESRAALDAYQSHPDHLAIKALVGPMRRERGQIDFFADGLTGWSHQNPKDCP